MAGMQIGTNAQREKHHAAMTSVIAAVGLTLLKIVIGTLTNSLGILSEALHSGFDLVAALVTLLAIRVSAKPPDDMHPFGHGKVENLSAMVETVLLMVTCVWIISEAVQRLFFKYIHVEATVWSFLVMGVSIVIDYSRSRILYRTARKYNSQALEADALHFRTDIWSSAVVIIGLIGVTMSKNNPRLHILEKMDAVAALGVAVIVVIVSLRLGKRTILGLIDTAPEGLPEKIGNVVESIPGVIDCHNIRVRAAGPGIFVDVHVHMEGSQTLDQAHRLTERIEEVIAAIAPDTDVTVHPEPASAKRKKQANLPGAGGH